MNGCIDKRRHMEGSLCIATGWTVGLRWAGLLIIFGYKIPPADWMLDGHIYTRTALGVKGS